METSAKTHKIQNQVFNFRAFSFWSLVLDFFNQVPNWPSDFNIYAIQPLI
jgi:hypothetical protein